MWTYSKDEAFEVIGFLGALILAVALLPQIYAVHKSRSTKDISYTWQAVYITGLIALLAYFAYFELWEVFFPTTMELFCILYLTALKIYFEHVAPKRSYSSANVTKNTPILDQTVGLYNPPPAAHSAVLVEGRALSAGETRECE